MWGIRGRRRHRGSQALTDLASPYFAMEFIICRGQIDLPTDEPRAVDLQSDKEEARVSRTGVRHRAFEHLGPNTDARLRGVVVTAECW